MDASEGTTHLRVTTNVVQRLQVTRTGVNLYVPNMGVTYAVASRLPLIQQTRKHYIAGIQRFDGSLQLVAFPRMATRREGTGWVTNDKFLIFASRAKSVAGTLELSHSEVLDILAQHEDHYEAKLERFGRTVVVRIPEGMGGITLIEEEMLVRTAVPGPAVADDVNDLADDSSVAEDKEMRRKGHRARKISVTFDEGGMLIEDGDGNPVADENIIDADSAGAMQSARIEFFNPTKAQSKAELKDSKTRERVIQELKEVVMLEIVAELQKSKTQLTSSVPSTAERAGGSGAWDSDAVLAAANSGNALLAEKAGRQDGEITLVSNIANELSMGGEGELLDRVEDGVMQITQVLEGATGQAAAEAVAGHPDFAEDEAPPFLHVLTNYSLMFKILLGVCILEAVLLLKMRFKDRKAVAGKDVSADSQVFSYNSGTEPMVSAPPAVQDPSEGDLTGTLDGYSMGQVVQFFNSSGDSGELTVRGGNGREDSMFFDDGHIINATCGELSGEKAVYEILRLQQGSFSFRRMDTSSRARVILQDTMSLLLEGHRLVDEQGFADA